MTDAFKAVETQLRAPAPEGLSRLDPDQLEDLADALRDARRRQASALAAAGEQAFGNLPRLLRAPVRRVLG